MRLARSVGSSRGVSADLEPSATRVLVQRVVGAFTVLVGLGFAFGVGRS